MVQCTVGGCSSRSDTVSIASRNPNPNAVHFHRAPHDPLLRKKWMQALNKHNFTKSTRVCSLHFKKENYYSTKLGFQYLRKGSVPELNLTKEITKDNTTDSSDYDTLSNMQLAKQNICYPSHSQKSSIKEKSPNIRTAENVLASSSVNVKPKPKEETTDSSEDEEMSDVQLQEQNIHLSNNLEPNSRQSTTNNVTESTITKPKEETTDSSEDEEMSDVQPQEQNIHLSNNLEPNLKQSTTNNVTESTIIKPGVQKHKLKTALERKLFNQVTKLQESSKQKMEAIHCLLEQNKRLLERNSFLEKALDNSKQSSK